MPLLGKKTQLQLSEWILVSGKWYLQNQLCWNVIRCNRRMQECNIFILVITEVFKCKYNVCVYNLILLYTYIYMYGWKNFSLTLPPSWLCSGKYWTCLKDRTGSNALVCIQGFFCCHSQRGYYFCEFISPGIPKSPAEDCCEPTAQQRDLGLHLEMWPMPNKCRFSPVYKFKIKFLSH